MATLEERLATLEGIPVPPQALMRALELLQDTEVDFGELQRTVVQEQALSLLVLRTANSSMFGGLEPVQGLREAMARLGTSGLRRLITAHFGADLMSEAGRGYGLDAESARQGALAGAIAAERVANRCGANPDVAFTAALLRDCGKLVLDQMIGVERLMREMSEPEGLEQLEHERLTYGCDHAEAGAALARHWGLPEQIEQAIAFHHEPPDSNEDLVIDAVHVADVVCAHLGLGVGYDGLAYPLGEGSLERAGVDRFALAELLADTAAELATYDPAQ